MLTSSLPPPAALTTTQLSPSDVVLVVVHHDQLTSKNCAAFIDELDLILAQSNTTILDLKCVAFLDSMVMKKLLKCQQFVNLRNGQLILINLSQTVNALFELIGLSAILNVSQDLDSAMALLSNRSKKMA